MLLAFVCGIFLAWLAVFYFMFFTLPFVTVRTLLVAAQSCEATGDGHPSRADFFIGSLLSLYVARLCLRYFSGVVGFFLVVFLTAANTPAPRSFTAIKKRRSGNRLKQPVPNQRFKSANRPNEVSAILKRFCLRCSDGAE